MKSGGVKTWGSKNGENRKNKKKKDMAMKMTMKKKVKLNFVFVALILSTVQISFVFSCSKREKNESEEFGYFFERKGVMSPKSIWCAVRDSSYSAPVCPQNVDGCSTCLDGVGDSAAIPEPYQPNSIFNSCPDQAGTSSSNSSINSYKKRIRTIEVESLSQSGFIEPGQNIKVTVRAWCNNYADFIDIFFADDADSPNWQYVGSCKCGISGSFINTGSFPGLVSSICVWYSLAYNEFAHFILTLPNVSRKMAIRARIQNSGSWRDLPCYTSSSVYDHDDLVFTVQNPPSSFTCGVYDPNFQAPVCYGDGWCGTCELVPCRDNVNDYAESPTEFFQCPNGGNETNQPNTLFSGCADANDNDPNLLDEQIRRINIRSLSPSGKFEGGQSVEVSMLVSCTAGTQIVLAYASGITFTPYQSANWRYLTTILCPTSPLNQRTWNVIDYTFRLDNVEGFHAVRGVIFRCQGCSAVVGNVCPNYNYRDADDLVFLVKPSSPSNLPPCAVFDNATDDGDPAYRTPKCRAGVGECSTCNLIVGRYTSEPNYSNTLATTSSCSDQSGTYDVWIDRLDIKSNSNEGTFSPGSTAEVNILINCPSSASIHYSRIYLALLYTSDANLPSWQRVLTSAACTTAGKQLFKTFLNLDSNPGNHAIRAMVQFDGFSPTQTCASGPSADTDDLVFVVGVPQAPLNFDAEGLLPNSITLSWIDTQSETYYELRWTDTFDPDYSEWIIHSASPLPANTSWYVDSLIPEGTHRCYALRACNTNGCSSFVWDCSNVPSPNTVCAQYDPIWKVPVCPENVNNCSTCQLVISRDNLPSRAEQNTPNAWYSSPCLDGEGGDWYSSRSIEKIMLSTPVSSFSSGYPISVTVRVFCSSTADYIHLYVSSGTSPISWVRVGSSGCVGTNQVENKTFSFTPSSGGLWYVIRASLSSSTPSFCPTGRFDEVDDIAIRVSGAPDTPRSFNVTFVEPDVAHIRWNDVSGESYYRLVSAPSPYESFVEDIPHSPFPENTTYHEHSGMQPGEVLCFKLSACNEDGCSPETVTGCAVRAPDPPYNLQVTAYSTEGMGTNSRYFITFIDNSVNEDGFVIERTTNGSTWTRDTWVSNSTTYTGQLTRVYTLAADVRWCFRVASFKRNPMTGALSLSSWADNTTKCLVGLKAPSSLYGEGTPNVRTIKFFWKDNSSYELEQNFEWKLYGSSTYTKESVLGKEYYQKQFPSEDVYCIRITNGWVGSGTGSELGSYSIGYSNELCKLAMGVPSPLNIFVEEGGVRLTWQDNATQETSFRIYYTSFDGVSGWVTLASLPQNTSSFFHSISSSKRYCYFVRALKGTNYSDPSEIVCISYQISACSSLRFVDTGEGLPISEAPLDGGNTIYLSFSNRVSGIWKNGNIRWRLNLPPDSGSVSSNICSVSQDRIFLGTTGGWVYTVSKVNGMILKRMNLGPGSVEGCAISSEGEIFATTSTGYIYKLDTGLNVLAFQSLGSAVTAPAIDEARGKVYVPRQNGVIFVYNMNLAQEGSVNLGTGINSGVAIGPKGEIYVGGSNGYLYMVTRVGSNFYVKSAFVGGSIVVSPVVYQWGAEVTVVVGSDTGVVKAFRLDSNMNLVEIWSQTLGGGIRGSPVIVGDMVFLGVGGNVEGRKITDGSSVCSYSLGVGTLESPLEIGGGDVVIGDSAGRLHIIAGGGEATGGGWWVSYQMRGKRAVGSLYTTNRALAYEEARYCPYSSAPGSVMFSVIAGDIRGDYAGGEIFAVNNAGTNYTGTTAYLISASGSTAGEIIWSYSIGRGVWSVPATGDIDGDGQPEIVIGVDDGRVMVFGGNGLKAQISLCGPVRAVTLADVDGNGEYEIIAVAKKCNRVYVLDWDGSSLYVLRSFDLTSDSDNNSYAVWYKNSIYITGLSGNLYIFDYPSYSTTVVNIVSGYGLDTPAIGDVDGDGAKEVVFGGRDGKVYIRGWLDGASEGSVDLTSYVGSAVCFRISLGDANSNGRDEIYVVATDCSNTGNSYLISIEWNETISSYQVKWARGPFGGVIASHSVVADFDLDGVGEVATITHDGTLYVYRYDGSLSFVGRYYFSDSGGRGGVSVIDVDRDGRQNLVFGDRAGCVHVFEFGDGTASGTIWWGYNRQNPQQNGLR